MNNYIELIVWLLSVTIYLLIELSCFWLFVKLLVYFIKVESFSIQDYRGAQCPLPLFRGNTAVSMVCLSICVGLSVLVYLCWSVCLSICVGLSVCLSVLVYTVGLSVLVCLSVCLYIYQFV